MSDSRPAVLNVSQKGGSPSDWNVGTQGWYGYQGAFGACPLSTDPATRKAYGRDHGPCQTDGICAPLDWSVPSGIAASLESNFGILPLN